MHGSQESVELRVLFVRGVVLGPDRLETFESTSLRVFIMFSGSALVIKLENHYFLGAPIPNPSSFDELGRS